MYALNLVKLLYRIISILSMLIRKILKSIKLFWLFKKIAIIILHLKSKIFITMNAKMIKALNLGSGPLKSPNQLFNVDLFGADINFDLTKKFPFKDNSIEFIYTSHFLEHLSFNELNNLLSECYRVLKPDSKISIVVPNARLYIDAYINNDPFLSYQDMFEGGKVETGSSLDQINSEFTDASSCINNNDSLPTINFHTCCVTTIADCCWAWARYASSYSPEFDAEGVF